MTEHDQIVPVMQPANVDAMLERLQESLKAMPQTGETAAIWSELMALTAETRALTVTMQSDPQAAQSNLARLCMNIHRLSLACLAIAAPRSAASRLPAQQTQALRVDCLGRFKLWRNDVEIEFDGNGRAGKLFKYLLFRPQRAASKDMLMDLYWSNLLPEQADHNLRMAVSALRADLDLPGRTNRRSSIILSGRGQYRINPDIELTLDVDFFLNRYVEAGRLDRANDAGAIPVYEEVVRLYHDDFLTEDIYEDWTIPIRNHYLEIYLLTLNRLAQHYTRIGAPERSIDMYNRILAKDSCNENAIRDLMVIYSRLGWRAEALRCYRDHMEILQRELDAIPAHDLTILWHRIRDGQAI